jgi:hypothetical protein
VVYAKKPFGGPQAVLAYLSRYTHRVAISNRRLVSADEPRVLPRPCPCCGGRMIIIETFARGCEPKHRPKSAPGMFRIDTS